MQWKLSEIKVGGVFNKDFKSFLKKPLIYKLLFPNGKVYVGQTKNIVERIKNYLRDCEKDRFVVRAIKKYSREDILFSILETCNQTELNDREAYYISFFQSNNKMFGYNLTRGGNYEFLITPEITQNKIKGSPTKKKVGCYDLTGKLLQIYESLSAAERDLGIPVQDIIRCCKHKNKGSRNNLMFSKDLEDHLEPYIKTKPNTVVHCYVFDKDGNFLSEHSSISDAGKAYGISSKFATTYIRTGGLVQNSFYISYVKDFKIPVNRRWKIINIFDAFSNTKIDTVKGIETCALKYNMNYSCLYNCIRKNKEYQGLIFKYEC